MKVYLLLSFVAFSTIIFSQNLKSTEQPNSIIKENNSTLDITDPELGLIQVYPNPSTGKFAIYLTNLSANASYRIIDATGKTITEKTSIINERTYIDLNEDKGLFFIYLNIDNTQIIRRLIVN